MKLYILKLKLFILEVNYDIFFKLRLGAQNHINGAMYHILKEIMDLSWVAVIFNSHKLEGYCQLISWVISESPVTIFMRPKFVGGFRHFRWYSLKWAPMSLSIFLGKSLKAAFSKMAAVGYGRIWICYI